MLSLRVVGCVGLTLSLLIAPVLADCECGYSVNSTSDETHAVFTDVLESDFTTLKNITWDTDWVVQSWKVDKEASKGPYGRSTETWNVESNPIKNKEQPDTGLNGEKPGLELWVRTASANDEYIGVGEADSRRSDMLYGSFRAGIEIPAVSGTCAAFFWYLNDTQEIDMEFLTRQMNETFSPVNLVLHSALSQAQGGDATNTPTYKIIPLPFHPANGTHEYRFDWQPGVVTFYADGQYIDQMADEKYVPSSAGKIILSHWSNGQPLWSGGPPAEDAKMLVQYVKAYFNSSTSARIQDHTRRCPDPTVAKGICQIPDQLGAPTIGNVPFFYTDPSGNMTNNQSIYAVKASSGATMLTPGWGAMFFTVGIVGSMLVWGI